MAEQITNGGMQYVPQLAAVQQIVYLDFDGELTSYNGEILSLENVEVQNSSLTAERITNIVTALNEKYASQNVVFVTEHPQTGEYSTIFIGKTSAFDSYGSFTGLAETIDTDNQNKSDNAFVTLDTTATDTQIIDTIAHETDHLLGTLNHGGEGLNSYACEFYTVTGNITSGYYTNFVGGPITNVCVQPPYCYSRPDKVIDATLNNTSVVVAEGGVVSNVTLKGESDLYVSETAGAISDIVISSGGEIHNGARMTNVKLEYGAYCLNAGAINNLTVNGGSVLHIGSASENVKINGGILYVGSRWWYDDVLDVYSGSRSGNISDVEIYAGQPQMLLSILEELCMLHQDVQRTILRSIRAVA